jgi:hypothetical protein
MIRDRNILCSWVTLLKLPFLKIENTVCPEADMFAIKATAIFGRISKFAEENLQREISL